MTPRCTHIPLGQAAHQAAVVAATVPVVETERLRLRAPTLADLPSWTAWWQTHDPDWTDENAYGDFCVYVAGWMLHGHGVWAIETKSDATLVGFVLLGLEWDDAEPEIGYVLSPDARGQGFATEAARAARDHAKALFGEGGAVSYITPGNTASENVARRVGAHPDGELSGSTIWRHGGTA